jgi:quinol monooxygenase YgiN
MGFIQIIDHVTSKPDEVQALSAEFRASDTGATTGPSRVTITKDRDRDDHYLVIAEFESYETAMANSNDPTTQKFAEKLAALCDGPPTFYNLDLIRTETPGSIDVRDADKAGTGTA